MSERRSGHRRPSQQDTAASASEGDESNVKVVVRCRPLNEQEKAGSAAIAVNCNPKNSSVVLRTSSKANRERLYTFDDVYGAYSTQSDVYNSSVLPVVQDVLQGFNCTVFAYGQTGTGKTWTMEGTLSSDKHCDTAGVIPRSVNTIFSELERQGREFSIKVSFLELYNEDLSDLLCDEKRDLRLFEESGSKKGVMVHGLEEVVVTSSSQVFSLLRKAQYRRQVAATKLNKNSSRSHCVFTITVHTKDVLADGDEAIKTGKLHLVDLAGAECIGKSGAVNRRAKEAGNINKSLLTLGRVINALVERQGYVPYRDSKLTRLLQQSLGGSAKTCIIATLTPAVACCDESLSTLEYAHRAKNIRNKPQVNQKMTKQAYMKELVQEINSLQRENEALRQKNGVYLPQDRYDELTSGLTGKTAQLAELEMALDSKVAQLNELEALFGTKEAELRTAVEEKQRTEEQLVQTEGELCKTQSELHQTKGDFHRHRKALRFTVTELEDTKTAFLQTSQNLSTSQLRLSDVRVQLESLREDLHVTRISWEEEQELVKEHKRAKEAVTQQAIDLKNTLEYTIDREASLFDKVDRKAAVELNNVQASATLHTDFHQSLDIIRDQHSGFVEESSATLEHLRTRGGKLAQLQIRNSEKLTSHLDELEGLMKRSIPQATKSLDEFGSVAGEGLQAMHESATASSLQAQEAWTSAQKQILGFAEEMRALVTQQKEGLLAWYDHTQKTLSQQQKSLESFSVQQDAELELMHTNVSAAFDSQIQNLQVHEKTTQTLKAQQLDQNERLFSEFQTTMMSNLADMRKEQERSLEMALSKLQADFHDQQQSMHLCNNDFKTLSASVTSRTKEWTAKQTQELINVPRQELEKHYTAAMKNEDSFLSQADLLDSTVDSYGKVRDTNAQESLELLQDRADSAQGSLQAFSEKQSTWLQETADQHATMTNSTAQQLETGQLAEADLIQTSQSEVEALQDSIDGFGGDCDRSLAGLEARMTQFVSKDLREDKPTGKTPIKQVHSYPRTFHTSRPSDEVIQEFRSRNPAPSLDALEFPNDLLPLASIRKAPPVPGVELSWSDIEEEDEEETVSRTTEIVTSEGSEVSVEEEIEGTTPTVEPNSRISVASTSPVAEPQLENEAENIPPRNALAEEVPPYKGVRSKPSRIRAPSRSRASAAEQRKILSVAATTAGGRVTRSSRSRKSRATALR